MAARTDVRTRLRRGAGAWLVLVALVTTACSGGAAYDGATAGGVVEGPAESTAFCSAALDASRVISDGPGVGEATREETVAAFQEYKARLEPPLSVIERNAPPAVRQDVGTLARQARYAIANNDKASVETVDYQAADERLRAFVLRDCGFPVARVVATEYQYRGLPATIAAGTMAFVLANEGRETHDLNVYRIDDNATQPFADIAKLSELERNALVTSVGSVTTSPGSTETRFVTLTPGRYGVACFVPTGSTANEEGTGPQHATLGQVGEFVVP